MHPLLNTYACTHSLSISLTHSLFLLPSPNCVRPLNVSLKVPRLIAHMLPPVHAPVAQYSSSNVPLKLLSDSWLLIQFVFQNTPESNVNNLFDA